MRSRDLARQVFEHRGGARARRIEQHLVVVARRPTARRAGRRRDRPRRTRRCRCRWRRRSRVRARRVPASPSTPTTLPARRAIGSVKLPRPQKRSSTRSFGCGSSSSSARAIMRRFMPALTCTKSSGRNSISTSASAMRNASRTVLRPERVHAVGPARLQQDRKIVRPAERDELRRVRRPTAAARLRNTSATVSSPAEISICAIVRFASSDVDQLADRRDAQADFGQQRVALAKDRRRSADCPRGNRPAPYPSSRPT